MLPFADGRKNKHFALTEGKGLFFGEKGGGNGRKGGLPICVKMLG